MSIFVHLRRPSRTSGLAGLSALIVAGMATPALAGPTAFDPPSCGRVITRSTVLSADIVNCPGNGIVVRTDNITVNLNGHTVAGIGAQGNSSVGIRLQNAHEVRVTNGTVTGFDAGIAVIHGSGNTFTALDVHDNIGAPSLGATFGDGFFLMSTADNSITNSHVAHNGPFDGIGVYGAGPQRTGDPGPDPATTDNKIVNNVIEDNNLPVMFFGHLSYLDNGINLGAGFTGGSRTTIANNVIRRNVLNGITACSVFGNPCITTDNVIVNNDISENGQEIGVHPATYGINITDVIHVPGTGFPSDTFYPATNDLVKGNLVHDNLGIGIMVGSGNNRIIDNVAIGNDLHDSATSAAPLDLEDLSNGNLGIPGQTCGTNTWRGNTYGQGFPTCTTAGGHHETAPSASGASPLVASAAGARSSVDSPYVFHRGTSYQ